jgi:hypothetical protein
LFFSDLMSIFSYFCSIFERLTNTIKYEYFSSKKIVWYNYGYDREHRFQNRRDLLSSDALSFEVRVFGDLDSHLPVVHWVPGRLQSASAESRHERFLSFQVVNYPLCNADKALRRHLQSARVSVNGNRRPGGNNRATIKFWKVIKGQRPISLTVSQCFPHLAFFISACLAP